ncbi:MAG: hypothetical protein JST21_13335 [Bacteroidetes bacterium]|nr:hypothetical protein [Bacteroidota bacterium]
MIHNLPNNNLDKIATFDNAVFYSLDSSGKRVPVSLTQKVELINDNILQFTSAHLPLLEQNWNVFAAELFFHKKGLPFNITVHGTAWLVDKDELTVQFKVLFVEYGGQIDEKPFSLHESFSELLSNTGMFFKRMLASGF